MTFVLLEMVAMFCGTLRTVAEARRDADIALAGVEMAQKNETLARLEAENLRKDMAIREQLAASIPKENLVVCGPLTLNTLANQAFLNDVDLLLTPKEFALLQLLIRHEGELLARTELYEAVWKQPYLEKDKTLKSSISRLRGKLYGSGYQVEAVRGKGYRLTKAPAEPEG